MLTIERHIARSKKRGAHQVESAVRSFRINQLGLLHLAGELNSRGVIAHGRDTNPGPASAMRYALLANLDLGQVKLRDIGTRQEAIWTATSRNVDLVEATRRLADRGPIATADVFKMKADQLHASVLEISRKRVFSRQRAATYAGVGRDSVANLWR